MLQIITQIIKDPEDHTKISLIFGNISEDDILCRERLEVLAHKHSDFRTWFTLDNVCVPKFLRKLFFLTFWFFSHQKIGHKELVLSQKK